MRASPCKIKTSCISCEMRNTKRRYGVLLRDWSVERFESDMRGSVPYHLDERFLMSGNEIKSSNEIKVHSEIEYTRADGQSVHSDLCPRNCNHDGLLHEEYKAHIHAALDEWLSKSNGSGYFYIASHHYHISHSQK